MKNHFAQSHAIYVKFLSPTNFRGSRVQLKTWDLSPYAERKATTKTVTYSHSVGSLFEQAETLIENAGLVIVGTNSSQPETTVYLCKWDYDKLAEFFGVQS